MSGHVSTSSTTRRACFRHTSTRERDLTELVDSQFRQVLMSCISHHTSYSLPSQGTGGLLVRKIDGDYQNVVGFPAASFVLRLELLLEEDEDFLAI
jgi:predicted house-cleaning NTP pyrophosphatase (Maf/HAM1 superfamily)